MRALSLLEEQGPIRISTFARLDRCPSRRRRRCSSASARRGLVSRQTDPDDCRAVLVGISDDGRRWLAEARHEVADALTPHFAHLEPEQVARISDGLVNSGRSSGPPQQSADHNDITRGGIREHHDRTGREQAENPASTRKRCGPSPSPASSPSWASGSSTRSSSPSPNSSTPPRRRCRCCFTSYMLVTGVAMLFTGMISRRIGAKKTLLWGLAIIVVFAAAAARRTRSTRSSASVPAGVWATHCSSRPPRGDRRRCQWRCRTGDHPVRGGARHRHRRRTAGRWSARQHQLARTVLRCRNAHGHRLHPDHGDAAKRPSRRTGPRWPHRSSRCATAVLLTVAITALLYNYGFFTLLAYTPFPLDMGAYSIGFIFFGWGVALAIASVFWPRACSAASARCR